MVALVVMSEDEEPENNNMLPGLGFRPNGGIASSRDAMW
jgi:hypothetical protein